MHLRVQPSSEPVAMISSSYISTAVKSAPAS